ncbi:hypothetical protein ACE7GA_16655 [Roseomonas sp. CCTCC AB2023176]
MTLLELEKGVLRIERRDPVAGAVFRRWLDGTIIRHLAAAPCR